MGAPFEGQYGHVYQSYKNRHPLTQGSTSRDLFCRYPCTCKDVCVKMSVKALFTMARYWKQAEGPLVRAIEVNDGKWRMSL